MDKGIQEKYERWLDRATMDPDLQVELANMAGNEDAITDAFYTDLKFGTAGLRGVIGAGTNRMNIYVVAEASKAMGRYVLECGTRGKSIAIAYDSRIKSKLFAETAAAVIATMGVHVYLYPELMPTPCLSFAVRYLNCSAGVVVTASHNPAIYNGYKAYGGDGCQMTSGDADKVYGFISEMDVFDDVSWRPYQDLLKEGAIELISPEVETAYIEEVKKRSVLQKDAAVDRNVSIVYTPLNGAGLKPVQRVLRECGFTNITVVKAQEEPDGHFPTCPYPNPEMLEAMALGIETCKEVQADLLLATDPDSDRTSIAVRMPSGEYRILSGNELGCLLLDFILKMRTAAGTLPERAVTVKSIVTTDLASKIAEKYGVEMRNVLTGFKYIGEQIGFLEKAGEEGRFVFGFEESCGFLSGSYVRDKDAVVASMLVAEMFVYYRSIGLGLPEKLNALGREFGFFCNKVHQYEYPGIEGQGRMAKILKRFREEVTAFGDWPVLSAIDYSQGIGGLPKADVVRFELPDDASVIIRPSGTEPKIKVYMTAAGESAAAAASKEEALLREVEQYL